MTYTARKLSRTLVIGVGIFLISATACHAEGNLATAQEMFAEHRYAAGLVPLRKAAEIGDRNARRTLGLMLLYGEALYGAEVPTDREQGLRWIRLAAVDGCEISRHVLAKLGKTS
jgi:TPR repeat protein